MKHVSSPRRQLAIVLAVVSLFANKCSAQCGPDQSRPYPPGQNTCPPGPDGGGPSGGGSPGGGNTGGGDCSTPPCAASLLGDVGHLTVSGTDSRTGNTFEPGENIYGPFEAGFGAQQNFILEGLGCSSGSLGHVAGGIDTNTAEQMVAKQCSVTLPRVEGNEYISLLDECGGHTKEYHFHEKFTCLYAEEGGHSTQVGKMLDNQLLYGKWEDFTAGLLPQLDACGGHFGITPDSQGERTYHYHVQDKAPFTVGCFGPVKVDDGDNYKLVTVSECRALYDGCGKDIATIEVASGSISYDDWCPCYDAAGSNVNNAALPVFSGSTDQTHCSGSTCSTFDSALVVSASGACGWSYMAVCLLLVLLERAFM